MSLVKPLLKILDLEKINEQSFVGKSIDIGSPQVYGGQVAAQALVAAIRTVPLNREVHSLHSYFLRRGDTEKDIIFEVQILRDGRSFSSRRVTANQEGKIIYVLAASFQIKEEGLEHQRSMPNVTQPESLTPFSEVFARFAEQFEFKPRGLYGDESPILFKPVETYDPFNPGKLPPYANVWFKPAGEISPDPIINTAIMTYASDFNLLIVSLLPHDLSLFMTPMHIASLDHSMWIHRPIDLSDWHLYSVESLNANNNRGFSLGKIFNRNGQLVATVAQEGLIRIMNKK